MGNERFTPEFKEEAVRQVRDRHLADRTRPVRPPQQLVANLRPAHDEVTCGLFDVQTIHASRTLVSFDTPPRLPQVLSCQYRL